MNPSRIVLILLIMLSINGSLLAQDSSAPAKKITLAGLKSVPPGNYLVTLEVDGKIKKVNLLISANRGKVVKSSDPDLNNVEATFQPYDGEGRGHEGKFIARLQGSRFLATQLWIFRADGVAAIREAPDRGEIQSAIPVKGDTLESAATGK